MRHCIRNTALTICFLLITGGAALAQGVHVGIKAGFNRTSVAEFRFRRPSNNLDTESPGYRTGIHAGIYAELALPFISIQPEVSYSQKGFRFEAGGAKADARLNYIEVPLLFKYRLIPLIYLFIGPQVSFMSTTSYEYAGAYSDYELRADGIDFSALAGAGVTFGRFDFSGRFGWGLSSVFKEDGISSDRERFAQLSAGFRLFSIHNK